MASEPSAFGPAKWQEPLYYFPKMQERPRNLSLYEKYTENLPAMPSCYPRYATPLPSRTPSPLPLRGRSRHRLRGSSKNRDETPGWRTAAVIQRKKIWYQAVAVQMDQPIEVQVWKGDVPPAQRYPTRFMGGLAYGLVHLLIQLLQLVFECILCLICAIALRLLQAAVPETKTSDNHPGVNLANTRIASKICTTTSLAGGVEDGWSELYARIDARAAKLRSEQESIEAEETYNTEADSLPAIESMERSLMLDSKKSEELRKQKKAVQNYERFCCR